VTGARVREAERRLRARQMSVAEVAFSLGFASQSHFTAVFRRLTGTTPKCYQTNPTKPRTISTDSPLAIR
jgi:AraC family transcriptional regulator